MRHYDFAIVGSGIVGVSAAFHLLLKNPKAKIIILEKEPYSFYHQSGRNSGVIHAGVYYKPDSLKAKFCIQGLHDTYNFCKKIISNIINVEKL